MVTKLLGKVETEVPLNVVPETSVPAAPVGQQNSPHYPQQVFEPENFASPPPPSEPSFTSNKISTTQDGFSNRPSNYAPGPTAQIRPAQFSPLHAGQQVAQPDNLGLILDVSLQVSVELGKARKTIREILDMGPGSVVELDRLAGEPVDMIINGKLIAKCEVVVINETFGIRITEIINPIERMKTLN
jgi:flagellar motor switch protein FliN/FliY